jgi:hypothetical protein
LSLNPTITTFRDTIRRISPSWLQGFFGYRLTYSIAIHLDAFGDGLVAALKLRFPNLYTPETLALIGRERGIRRGPDEIDAAYAARLRVWWETHKHDGNPYTLMTSIAGYLSPHPIVIRDVNNAGAWYTRNADGTTAYVLAGNWNWDNDSVDWSRIWLIIFPGSLWTKTGAWGVGAPWGPDTFGNPTWGSSATPAQVAGVRAVAQGHAAHADLVNVIVAFDATKFDPAGGGLPDGTWGEGYKLVAGAQVATREPTAIYWKGDD